MDNKTHIYELYSKYAHTAITNNKISFAEFANETINNLMHDICYVKNFSLSKEEALNLYLAVSTSIFNALHELTVNLE